MQMGMRIRLRRTELRWTQQQLAEKANVSRPLVTQIEKGEKTDFRTDHLRGVATALYPDLEPDAALRLVLFGEDDAA